MTVMSMILVMVTWEVYRDSAIKSQQLSLEEVLVREADRILRGLDETTEAFAISAQSSASFRPAPAAVRTAG